MTHTTHGEHKGSHEEFTEGSHDVTNEEKYQVTEGDCANRLELTGTLCGKEQDCLRVWLDAVEP